MMSEAELDRERALVFLDAWGTGETCEPWEGPTAPWYGHAIDCYAPEWVESADGMDGAVTAIHHGFSAPVVPPGYALVSHTETGERECPWCSEVKQSECALCEGDGLLYWGCDASVVVFMPRWVVGCQRDVGALYDWRTSHHDLGEARLECAERLREAMEHEEPVNTLASGRLWEVNGTYLVLDDLRTIYSAGRHV